MSHRDEREWLQDYELTRLFVAKHLGPRPRRVADQDAAIQRASDMLDSLTSHEAMMARRFLAIESVALKSARRRARPTEAEWMAAIEIVDTSDDLDVRRLARGGMSLRAASGDWDRHPG